MNGPHGCHLCLVPSWDTSLSQLLPVFPGRCSVSSHLACSSSLPLGLITADSLGRGDGIEDHPYQGQYLGTGWQAACSNTIHFTVSVRHLAFCRNLLSISAGLRTGPATRDKRCIRQLWPMSSSRMHSVD